MDAKEEFESQFQRKQVLNRSTDWRLPSRNRLSSTISRRRTIIESHSVYRRIVRHVPFVNLWLGTSTATVATSGGRRRVIIVFSIISIFIVGITASIVEEALRLETHHRSGRASLYHYYPIDYCGHRIVGFLRTISVWTFHSCQTWL